LNKIQQSAARRAGVGAFLLAYKAMDVVGDQFENIHEVTKKAVNPYGLGILTTLIPTLSLGSQLTRGIANFNDKNEDDFPESIRPYIGKIHGMLSSAVTAGIGAGLVWEGLFTYVMFDETMPHEILEILNTLAGEVGALTDVAEVNVAAPTSFGQG